MVVIHAFLNLEALKSALDQTLVLQLEVQWQGRDSSATEVRYAAIYCEPSNVLQLRPVSRAGAARTKCNFYPSLLYSRVLQLHNLGRAHQIILLQQHLLGRPTALTAPRAPGWLWPSVPVAGWHLHDPCCSECTTVRSDIIAKWHREKLGEFRREANVF